MKKILYLTIPAALLTWSCDSTKEPNVDDITAQASDSLEAQEVIEIDPDELSGIIQSIPSPLEISFLIKDVGGEYNNKYLNSTDKIDQYANSYDQALNMGVYGANLAYANIYDNKSDGQKYLGAVRGLAKELSIEQFFDLRTLSRLIKNDENLDSLLLITTSNFEKISIYLQEQNNSHLSILLLAGGWIEGLHLICQVNANNPNPELAERIGEQKLVLEQLLKLTDYYTKDSRMREVHDDLVSLNSIYKDITIEFVEGDVTYEEIDGMMMVVDNSYSKVNMTESQLAQIGEKASSIRQKMVK